MTMTGKTSMPRGARFYAKCRLRRWKPEKKLTVDERQEATANGYPRVFNRDADDGKGRMEVGFPKCGGFETEDRDLFDDHMIHAHGAPRPHGRSKHLTMWKGPRLTDEGKPFEPKDLEPGAAVTWRELVPTGEAYEQNSPEHGTRTVEVREWSERGGQVWSLAGYPTSAWVIPFERLKDELAVCVQLERDGTLRHKSTQLVGNRWKDAA